MPAACTCKSHFGQQDSRYCLMHPLATACMLQCSVPHHSGSHGRSLAGLWASRADDGAGWQWLPRHTSNLMIEERDVPCTSVLVLTPLVQRRAAVSPRTVEPDVPVIAVLADNDNHIGKPLKRHSNISQISWLSVAC